MSGCSTYSTTFQGSFLGVEGHMGMLWNPKTGTHAVATHEDTKPPRYPNGLHLLGFPVEIPWDRPVPGGSEGSSISIVQLSVSDILSVEPGCTCQPDAVEYNLGA